METMNYAARVQRYYQSLKKPPGVGTGHHLSTPTQVAMQKTLLYAGLMISNPVDSIPYSGDAISQRINRSGTYHILGLEASFRGGHAIALHLSRSLGPFPKHLYIFDPNLGEFRIRGSEFRRYFSILHDYYSSEGLPWSSIKVASIA